jgi:hypothetical protein
MAFLPSVFFQFVPSLKSNIPISERKLGLNSSVEKKVKLFFVRWNIPLTEHFAATCRLLIVAVNTN